jgi:SAM-dependent methyltransferase
MTPPKPGTAASPGRFPVRHRTQRLVAASTPHHWAPGQRVLSVADGEGRNSVWLAAAGCGSTPSTSRRGRRGDKARRLAASQGVTVDFTVSPICDGWAWPQAAYDGVAAIFVQFADPALRARLFAHIVDSLKPGGVLVLQGYTPSSWSTAPAGRPCCRTCTPSRCCARPSPALEIVTLREPTRPRSPKAAATVASSALVGPGRPAPMSRTTP